MFQCVGDLIGILDALEIEQATLAGHDFGTAACWSAAIMRPDRFSAVFCLSVPPLPLTRPSMLEHLRAAGKLDFYMFRQMRSEADAEWADASVTIPGMYYWTSGAASADSRWDPMDPARGLNRPSPVGLPDFVDPRDASAAIAEFQRFGFHAPLNYYRAMQPYFEAAGAFAGATVGQPSFFVFGAEDGMVQMRETPEAAVRKAAPSLRVPATGRRRALAAARGDRTRKPSANRVPARCRLIGGVPMPRCQQIKKRLLASRRSTMANILVGFLPTSRQDRVRRREWSQI